MPVRTGRSQPAALAIAAHTAVTALTALTAYAAFLAFAAFAAGPLSAQDGGASAERDSGTVLLAPHDVPWEAVGDSGLEIARLVGDSGAEGSPFVFRLRLPDGFEMAPHTHPVAEHMTVLSGRFFVGVGEAFDHESAIEYRAGSYVMVDAGVPAYMFTVGETVVQVHGIGPLRTIPVG